MIKPVKYAYEVNMRIPGMEGKVGYMWGELIWKINYTMPDTSMMVSIYCGNRINL